MQISIGSNLVQDKIIHDMGVESKIGYLLSGPLSPSHSGADIDVFHMAVVQCDNTRFWDIEQVGTSLITQSKATSAEHIRAFTDSSVCRDSDGSYIVGFPWKTDNPPLPSNRGVCDKRAQSLACKLAQTSELLKTYGAIITDQLSRGFIERVQESDVPENFHFIPHHAVKKESTTTMVEDSI